MRNQRFAGIRERLLRGGVAPRHVSRTIEELEHHFTDLVAEFESTGLSETEAAARAAMRLGSDDTVVASVLARPELRSWGRRLPWLAFGLLPIVGFAALFVLSLVVFVEIIEFAQHTLGWTHASSPGLFWLRTALLASTMWIAPLVAAGGACVQAARRRATIWWPLSATIVIGLLSALTTVSFDWPTSAPHGEMSAGLGLNSDTIHLTLGHAAITIAIALIPYFWWQRTHHHATTAPAET